MRSRSFLLHQEKDLHRGLRRFSSRWQVPIPCPSDLPKVKKGLNTESCISAGIPGPLSHTSINKHDGPPSVVITTLPDSGETASQAFRTTFDTARSRSFALYQPIVESLMAMSDGDASECRPYLDHPHCAPRRLDDVANPRTKKPLPFGAFQQVGNQFFHPVDGETDFLIEFVPLPSCLRLIRSRTPRSPESLLAECEGRETSGPPASLKKGAVSSGEESTACTGDIRTGMNARYALLALASKTSSRYAGIDESAASPGSASACAASPCASIRPARSHS